ncbi:MAG: hypothetical protein L0I29_15525 [Hyphomicrobiales bacterium]|nr:hypothetical protein [Hyphomicrobiales bacterium]
MTSTNTLQHSRRPILSDAATHLFAVGQAVRLKGGFGRPALPSGIYHVTATLPPRGDSLQYRIRNDDERYERVTTQDSLEPVSLPQSSGATLIERTFDHGQRTET